MKDIPYTIRIRDIRPGQHTTPFGTRARLHVPRAFGPRAGEHTHCMRLRPRARENVAYALGTSARENITTRTRTTRWENIRKNLPRVFGPKAMGK